jgi:DNA mismatch repair protein MutS
MPDLERLAGRAGQGLLTPREALALAGAVERAQELRRALAAAAPPALAELQDRLDAPIALVETIRATVVDDPPLSFGDGVIQAGRNPELDELKYESTNGKDWLLDLERRERERTGVKNLKVGYNRVFGYYVEISNSALSQPLDYLRREETGTDSTAALLEKLGYQRRQTVASGERFVLPELRDYESRQARSAARMAELEHAIFDALVTEVGDHVASLLRTGGAAAELDVLLAFAEAAAEQGYVRPELSDEPITEIVAGRHPVVERALGWAGYMPNDVFLAAGQADAPQVALLTGPNMAGKTTYGRMVLLVALLAQIGSFVPAERARLGIVDRLFLRSGASDDIAGGASTFMVEMTEAAAILRGASGRSLAFFDEVGRGTSTYDGMAIARAIVEYLGSHPDHGCRAIFSTHYHELAAVADEHPRVQNFRMDVVESANQVTFTYRVVPGSADRSYGVHVARLAGLPPSVVARAEAVLADLEAGGPPRPPAPGARTGSADPAARAILEQLAGAEVDAITPIEALNLLARLRAGAAATLARAPSTPGDAS